MRHVKPVYYVVSIFILRILFRLIVSHLIFLPLFNCFLIGLRELSPDLTLRSRSEEVHEASRGHVWWEMIARFCRYPWTVLYELSTKARGEF